MRKELAELIDVVTEAAGAVVVAAAVVAVAVNA